MSNLPRGIRNHNPGNIERGDPWQGLSSDQSSDSRFCVFLSPEWGIRAIARVLITYQDRHGINTIRGMIERWAPPTENKTGAYVQYVSSQVGASANESVDVTDYCICRPLVDAIIRFENGLNPDDPDGKWYRSATINRGLELAGIEVPAESSSAALEQDRPLSETRTVKGGQVAAAGGAISVIGAAVEQFAPTFPLVQTAIQAAPWVVGLLVLIGVGVIVGARMDDRRRGLR